MARPYVRTAERKKQIIDATLRMVSQHGVRGATLSRVAAEVGLTAPALYAHFPSRRELLLETMDNVFERVRELHRRAQHPDALERLREIGLGHTRLVLAEDWFARALFEFIAAPPEENLREALGAKELLLVEDLAGIVREGQEQGTIRPELDPYQIAWMIVSRGWTEDVSYLMGIADQWTGRRSEWMLEHLLDFIATHRATA